MFVCSNQKLYNKKISLESITAESISYLSINGDWNYNQRFSHTYEMFFVESGFLKFTFENASHSIGANSYLIIPPFSKFYASIQNCSCCSFYSVAFTTDYEPVNHMVNRVWSVSGNSSFLLELFKTMLSVYNPILLKNDYLSLLFIAAINEMEILQSNPVKADFPFEKIIGYIHKNLSAPINVEDLGERFNYSPDYISKNFKSYYGINAKTYITRVRLAAAKRLLASSELSLQKVGENIGITDVRLFYKFFKYHEHLTPFEYRKKHSGSWYHPANSDGFP